MTDIPKFSETTNLTEKLQSELATLLIEQGEIKARMKPKSSRDSHFFHVSQNLMNIPIAYLDVAKKDERELSEQEGRLVSKKLNLIKKYFSFFEDEWFEDRELNDPHGAFSNGKVYTAEEYINKAERLLQDRHQAELGLA